MKIKKILLIIVLFLLSIKNVNAETVLAYNLEKGAIYSKEDILDVAPVNYGTATEKIVHVAYLDKEGNLLEAFTASNGGEFTYWGSNSYGYPYSMFLWESVEFNFGNTCSMTYKVFSEEHEKWCDDYLNMYSSGKDISTISHWKVESVGEVTLSEFCENNPEVQDSFSCNEGLDVSYPHYDYYDLIILKEYAPAEFKLECNPKEVKKGETSNCQLKINTAESIKQVTIDTNFSNALFSMNEIKQIEGWDIVENEDGIITLMNENGFQGEGAILSTNIQFKEDIVDTIDIELSNIDYTTSTGYELNTSVKDDVTIYEEVKNPETATKIIEVLCIVLTIILLTIFVYYKFKTNNQEKTNNI